VLPVAASPTVSAPVASFSPVAASPTVPAPAVSPPAAATSQNQEPVLQDPTEPIAAHQGEQQQPQVQNR
jgi:hypothetical protein